MGASKRAPRASCARACEKRERGEAARKIGCWAEWTHQTTTIPRANNPTRRSACPQINFLTLLVANPSIVNPDWIFVGQELNLPCPPKIKCKATVIVQSGNTIPAIATANGVSLQDMLDANLHIVNSDLIFPGDVVFVPPCDQTPGSVAASAVKPARASCVPKKYVAKQGDKPGTIAATFNMQIGDLLRLNPRLRKFRTRLIKAGQLLDVLSCPKAVRPSFTSAQVCKSFYTVKADDTATTAAAAAKTTITKLMIANNFIYWTGQPLPAGRKLCIMP